MFANAGNMVISGGTFTQGEFHSHHVVNDGTGRSMQLLQQNIAPGAFHNSDERFDPPKCHPHTRRAVLEKIVDWVKDANKVALFLWLYGPAGAGKSAIAQTIAELLESLGLLAAAFFFSRNAAGRNDKTPLIATLVYQLIISIPEIRAYVLEALEQDPALFSRSIQAQVQALIIKPLNAAAIDGALAPTLLSRPRLIILDGLDECRTTSAQIHILNALSTAINHLHVPLCFLIASRPEQHIRDTFNDQSDGIGSLSFSIALDDTYQPDRDIQIFLQSTFNEIKHKHPSRAHFPTSWPTSYDIRRLVEKSSGQFIFASTVAKYLKSHRHWPPDRLKIIFGISKPDGQETPFAELDCLYHFVLSTVADIEKVKNVLMLLVLRPFSGWIQTIALIERFLFYRPGEMDMILSELHSIISVPPDSDRDEFSELQFFHASMPDFLLDRSRSTYLSLDKGVAYAKLARLAVKHINNPTESPLRNNYTPSLPHATFRICCVKARLSPELLEDLCGLNLAAHFSERSLVGHLVGIPELMCWFERQRLGKNGTETLLDHHKAAFDGWLRGQLLPYKEDGLALSYLLAAITLIDQSNVDSEGFNWHAFSMLLVNAHPPGYLTKVVLSLIEPVRPYDGTESHVASSQLVSKFLTDRERAGVFCVDSWTYVKLIKQLLAANILRDRYMMDYTEVRRIIPLREGDILTLGHNTEKPARFVIREGIRFSRKLTDYYKLNELTADHYEVGKLALDLLPALLSRLKHLGGSGVQEISVILRNLPPFHFSKNDRLEFEKVKTTQAIEEFLKA